MFDGFLIPSPPLASFAGSRRFSRFVATYGPDGELVSLAPGRIERPAPFPVLKLSGLPVAMLPWSNMLHVERGEPASGATIEALPVAAKPATAPRKARAKAPGVSPAEQFARDLTAARRNAGTGWHLDPTRFRWATIPAKLASYKTARGNIMRISRDQKIPDARFWPGEIPSGLDYADPSRPREGRTPEEMLTHVRLAIRDQIIADKGRTLDDTRAFMPEYPAMMED